MTDIKTEYKKAYIEGAKINKLNKELLARLHQKSPNAIEKYLYVPDRYPNFKDLFELFYFIKAIGGPMPLALNRILMRSKGRTRSVAIAEDMYVTISRRRDDVGKTKRFIKYSYTLNGKKVGRKDIEKIKGISHATVGLRLKGVENGADISHIDFSLQKTRKKTWSGKNKPNG